MTRSRLRLALPALLVTAGLAVSGCGSSDDGNDKGSDEAAYLKTYETACKAIADQMNAYKADMSGVDIESRSGTEQLKQAMLALFTTMDEQNRVMAGADAPERFAAFQKAVDDNAERVNKSVASVKDGIPKVKTSDEFTTLVDSVDRATLAGGKEFPAEMRKKAPSCKALQQ